MLLCTYLHPSPTLWLTLIGNFASPFTHQDVCAKHGLSSEDVFRLEKAPPEARDAMADAALEVATAAKQHLEHARELAPGLPAAARRALLPAAAVAAHLSALEGVNFDLLAPQLTRPQDDALAQARLWWHRLSGTY